MGGDGGTLAVKRSFLKDVEDDVSSGEAAAEAKNEHFRSLATLCALSKEELRKDVVVCPLGYIYDKEQLLGRLLSQDSLPKEFSHVKFNELVDCKFKKNPAFEDGRTDCGTDGLPSKFICPVSGLEFNGKTPFCVLRPSGLVVSLKALVEVPDCAEGQSVIPLFPDEQKRKQLRQELISRRKMAREKLSSKTRSKKSKRRKVSSDDKNLSANHTS